MQREAFIPIVEFEHENPSVPKNERPVCILTVDFNGKEAFHKRLDVFIIPNSLYQWSNIIYAN